ncbi:MAG: hypothetical protein ACLPX7_19460 [Xanthobacteraceae bacterium]
MYPRHVAKSVARIAFAKAIKAGADPEAVIEGARRYGAERAGQEPRYTAHPATWLRAERWLDEPARPNGGGPVIDEAGNPVEPRPRDRGGGREAWIEIVARMNRGSDEQS